MQQLQQTKTIGYLWGVLSAAFYGLNPLFALPLYADGMDAISVLFWRYALSVPLLAALMLARRIDFRLTRGEALQLVVLSGLMALSSICLYVAYNYMDAGLASTILFVYPIMTALLMAFLFHERVSPVVWGCLLLASAGIAILCEVDGPAKVSLIGIALVVLSALMYALYLVFVSRRRTAHMPSVKVTFYVILFGTVLLAGILLVSGHIAFPQGLHWGYSIGSALFPTALSLVLTALAIHTIGSTQTAILGALEPITAVIIGVTVFGEQLTTRSLIGIALIVVAVTVVIARKR